MFSKQISFTYEGEEGYSTLIGGIISIIIMGLLIGFGIIKFITMIERNDSNTSFNKTVNDVTTSGTVLNLGSSTFYFAMNLPYNNSNILLDSSYIDMSMRYIVRGQRQTSNTTISYDTCNNTALSFSDTGSLTKRSISSVFACPSSLNYTLQGNSYSDVYSFIQIVVKRCSGSSKCKSTTAIDNAINGLSLSFTMVNTYFDLEDYSSPVKTYLDDRINIAVTSGYTKTTVIFTQQRTSSKSDSYFSLWDTLIHNLSNINFNSSLH